MPLTENGLLEYELFSVHTYSFS